MTLSSIMIRWTVLMTEFDESESAPRPLRRPGRPGPAARAALARHYGPARAGIPARPGAR